jgi:hypothetical protein
MLSRLSGLHRPQSHGAFHVTHYLLAALLAAAPAWTQTLAFKNVSIVDPLAGTVTPGQTILINGERIEKTGPVKEVKIPRSAESYEFKDSAKAFVIPGLIDAHTHVVHQASSAYLTPEEMLPLHLGHGVTSLRIVGDEIVAQKMTQKYAAGNDDKCPRIFLSSPMVDGEPPTFPDAAIGLTDPALAANLIQGLKQWGVRTVPLYAGVDRAVGKRLIEEAHKEGLVVAAHLGKYAPQDAVVDGVDTIEHIWSVFNFSFPGEAPQLMEQRSRIDLMNPRAVALRDLMAQYKVAVCPQLIRYHNMVLRDQKEVWAHSDVALVPRSMRAFWEHYRRQTELGGGTLAVRQAELAKYRELTGLMHRQGILILAGTDAPMPYVTPGAALHRELELLVESGMTPAQALAAATIHVARVLRMETQLGKIEAGRLADMVVLSSNPLEDIRNTRKIAIVVRGGNALDPAKLVRLVTADQ